MEKWYTLLDIPDLYPFPSHHAVFCLLMTRYFQDLDGIDICHVDVYDDDCDDGDGHGGDRSWRYLGYHYIRDKNNSTSGITGLA